MCFSPLVTQRRKLGTERYRDLPKATQPGPDVTENRAPALLSQSCLEELNITDEEAQREII